MKRKAKLEEIKVWYKFRPRLTVWFTIRKRNSFLCKLPDETWYDGYPFNAGYFAFIWLKYFAIHIRFTWWEMNI